MSLIKVVSYIQALHVLNYGILQWLSSVNIFRVKIENNVVQKFFKMFSIIQIIAYLLKKSFKFIENFAWSALVLIQSLNLFIKKQI